LSIGGDRHHRSDSSPLTMFCLVDSRIRIPQNLQETIINCDVLSQIFHETITLQLYVNREMKNQFWP